MATVNKHKTTEPVQYWVSVDRYRPGEGLKQIHLSPPLATRKQARTWLRCLRPNRRFAHAYISDTRAESRN